MTRTTQPTHLVLYADDDLDDIKLVEEAFSETTDNVELVTKFNGIELLKYLNNLHQVDPNPCLIILDVNMPKMNGKDTLLRIREMDRFRHIPVVLFTTSSADNDKLFAYKHNAGFITKPLNNQQMKLITDEFIQHCTDDVKRSLGKA